MSDTSEQEVSAAGIGWRGMLMGLAEVVPGVSGGTMAFITGIYPELVRSLATFGPSSLPLLRQPLEFYQQHNLRFLLLLAAGMGMGILLFAQLMRFLLANYQPLVWAFFSGVILMSVLVIGRLRAPGALVRFMPLGLILGLGLLWLPTTQGEAGLGSIFAGGAVAVCAWLLPAVSGSYVLLALGLYGSVIDAIAEFDVVVLLTLAAGCVVGLLLFARLLAWLMRHYQEPLLSFLTGFMLGSLPKLWPWQDPAAGNGVETLMSPNGYSQTFAEPAFALYAALCLFAGAACLWLLNKVAND